ncbi:MAG: BatD family protein [Oscillospiraceae bacterium]|nr:BatD family protein [Oscillospiraceae bacterium]
MGKMVGKERRKIVPRLFNRLMVILCLALLAIYVFPAIPAQAAPEPEFRLDMDSLNLQKGVSCSLVITITNAQGAQVLDIEGLNNFDLIARNSSSSTTITGGSASHQETYYYTIMPKTAGDFKLQAAISYNNRVFETNELQVTVSDSSADGDESARDLFIKTTLSRDEAYLGEKIVMTHTLYTRYSIENYGFSDSIAIDGVIVNNIPSDQLKTDYEYLDGERYLVVEVNQSTIDPIRSGEYTIPSFNFRVDVITDSDWGGGFSGGFGGMFRSTTTVYAQTEEKELTVKPLPVAGKPAGFSGIVGQLRADGRYSRESMNYGESFVLNVTLSGECNLDGTKNVIGMATPGFSVYETLKNTVESVENDSYHIEKTYEVIIVPERTGKLNMPPIQISYFNPATEKYEVAEIPGITVEVLGDMPQIDVGGIDGQTPAFETMSIAQVNYAGGDEGYFKLRLKKELVYGAVVGLASALVVASVLIWFLSGRKKRDATLRSLYKRIMGESNIDEIYSLFNSMVKHCFDLSLKASSRAMIQSSLPDTDLVAGLTGIMDYMETVGAREAEGHRYLKDKIKEIYSKLTATARQAGKA